MQSNGKEINPASLPPAPHPEDFQIVRVVSSLIKLHPPAPFHDITFPEIVATCNFYDLEDLEQSVEQVIDIIHEINVKRNQPKKNEEPAPWQQ